MVESLIFINETERPEFLRSSKWPELRSRYLKEHPYCLICGRKENVTPHHIKPVHLFPELELVENNLITLCEEPYNHHLLFGHLMNWKSWNPTVRSDIYKWTNKILKRP